MKTTTRRPKPSAPPSKARTAAKAKRPPSNLREDDALALIHSIRGRSATAKRARALIAVAAGAGLRLGEIVAAVELRTIRRGETDPASGEPSPRTRSRKVLDKNGKPVRVPGLTGGDVRQDKAGRWWINVACGKRSKAREVPMRRAFVPFLVEWIEARQELRRGNRRLGRRDPLFCLLTDGRNVGFERDATVRVGDPMTDDAARGLLARIASGDAREGDDSEGKGRIYAGADLDVNRVHWHALRSAFATASIEDGVALPVVQGWLGHTSPSMSLHYAQRARAGDDVLDRVAGTAKPEPEPEPDPLEAQLAKLDADELRRLLLTALRGAK